MKKLLSILAISGIAAIFQTLPSAATEDAPPVTTPAPLPVQQIAPQGNLAPAYLFMQTKPADTVVPFFDVAKCDAAVKAVASAYKAACVHTQ